MKERIMEKWALKNLVFLNIFTHSTFSMYKESHFDILFPVKGFKTFPADHCARAKQAVSGMQFALSYSRFRMQRKLLRSKNKRSSENLFGNSLDMISILMGQILEEKQKLENEVTAQGDIVRGLKESKAEKDAIKAAVDKLLELKRQLALAQGKDPKEVSGNNKKGKKK